MNRKITGGLYVVADPAIGSQTALSKIEAALKGGVDIVQVWNHWHKGQDPEEFISDVCNLVHSYNKPVLVNQRWEWLMSFPLDGVHFDKIPSDWQTVQNFIRRPFITGVTCGNDRKLIEWAINNNTSYISFCAMFPSASADECEIVDPQIIREVRKITAMPIFVSGGITLENTSSMMDLGINGVAVISGIMKAEDPEAAARMFKMKLKSSK